MRITDSTTFPVSATIAAALVEVEPGGMREMHWHPNNDECVTEAEDFGRKVKWSDFFLALSGTL